MISCKDMHKFGVKSRFSVCLITMNIRTVFRDRESAFTFESMRILNERIGFSNLLEDKISFCKSRFIPVITAWLLKSGNNWIGSIISFVSESKDG